MLSGFFAFLLSFCLLHCRVDLQCKSGRSGNGNKFTGLHPIFRCMAVVVYSKFEVQIFVPSTSYEFLMSCVRNTFLMVGGI